TSGHTSGDDLSHGSPGRIEMLPATADELEDDDADIYNTQLDSGDSGIGKKVTHSILGAAPVLLTATALYRVYIYFVIIYHYSTNL
ncbi:CYIR protein, partial [Plasmodium cynomolgi strain B]